MAFDCLLGLKNMSLKIRMIKEMKLTRRSKSYQREKRLRNDERAIEAFQKKKNVVSKVVHLENWWIILISYLSKPYT